MSDKDIPKEAAPVTDNDMEQIQTLKNLGFGNDHLPDNAEVAFNLYRKRNISAKVKEYNQYMDAVRYILHSNNPKHKAIRDASNAGLIKNKVLDTGDVHVDQVLSNMSVQYSNEEFIGEQLMPAVLVPNISGSYFVYTQRDHFSGPDDEMGSNSEANEISKTRSTSTYTCRSRALKDHIGADVIANQDAPLNEMVDLIEDVNEVMALKREQRIATVMTTAGNFGANTGAIAAANRWDTAGGGNPISDIQTAMAALWRGRGPTRLKFFSSLDLYHVLSRHPDILGLFQYNGSSPGLATPDMIARFLGADEYLVSAARQDTANEAATATYTRIWGDSFGMARVSESPSIRSAHFGSTFRWNLPGSNNGVVTKEWFNPARGIIGSWYGEVGVSETHDVVSALTGYLITTPIN